MKANDVMMIGRNRAHAGMIASTCLAVLFVPAFFVIVQRFEEWLAARKRPAVDGVPAE